MNCKDIYIRYTSTDGKAHVFQHRVWDAERFVAAQVAAADALNANVKGDGPRLARAEQITETQFRGER